MDAPATMWAFVLGYLDEEFNDGKPSDATSAVGAVALISWVVIGIAFLGIYILD